MISISCAYAPPILSNWWAACGSVMLMNIGVEVLYIYIYIGVKVSDTKVVVCIGLWDLFLAFTLVIVSSKSF